MNSSGQRIAKKKTHVKKRTLSPVFNESFVFDIPQGGEALDAVSLEFLLLDWDRVTKNEVGTLYTFSYTYLLLISHQMLHHLTASAINRGSMKRWVGYGHPSAGTKYESDPV